MTPTRVDELYLRLRPRLFGLCLQRLGNPDDAEDAVAEDHAAGGKGASSFRWRGGGLMLRSSGYVPT